MDRIVKYFDRLSLIRVSFLQASLQVGYIALVAILFWKGNELFGKVNNYLGPVMFLVLFVVSVLVSALITLGYPFVLFWIQEKPGRALQLVFSTTAWLLTILLLLMFTLLII